MIVFLIYPLPFNITQTEQEQRYAERAKNCEVECKRQYMLAVYRTLENIDAVGHR